jgi:hypothetical protein
MVGNCSHQTLVAEIRRETDEMPVIGASKRGFCDSWNERK